MSKERARSSRSEKLEELSSNVVFRHSSLKDLALECPGRQKIAVRSPMPHGILGNFWDLEHRCCAGHPFIFITQHDLSLSQRVRPLRMQYQKG